MDNKKTIPSKRMQRAKSDLTPNRSTQNLKTGFREKFLARVKLSRSHSVDRFRQILEDNEDVMEYNSIEELRRILLEVPEANYLLSDSAVIDLMNEVQTELNEARLEQEASQQNHILQMETSDIISRHLIMCVMCETEIVYGVLCPSCRENATSEFPFNT